MVRSWWFPIVLAIFALSFGACAHRPPPHSTSGPLAVAQVTPELASVGITVREIAPDVFLAMQQSPNQSSANVLVVRMRDGGVVICSSPYDTRATRALVRYIRAALHPTRIVAVNTHFHADGTAGNEGYVSEGVETYASEHTVALQTERGVAGIEGMARYVESDAPEFAARIRATRVVTAQHVFVESEGLSLAFGEEVVRVRYVGAAHSVDNVVVWFPERGVLFGGCMVRSFPGLGFTADADVSRWAASVDAAAALGPRLVIPGHGAPGGPELLAATAAAARVP